MLRNSIYSRIIACAAGAAMLLPTFPVMAAPETAEKVVYSADAILVDGQLKGRLLNASGEAVQAAVVTVKASSTRSWDSSR